jgi:hypothetical protein
MEMARTWARRPPISAAHIAIALIHDTVRTTTVHARTPLLLYTFDRHHFVAAVSHYSSSAYEAEVVVRDRLDAFEPGEGPAA